MEDASKLPILARIGAVWVVITAGKISISGVTEYSRYPYGKSTKYYYYMYLLRTECSKLPKNGSSHTTTTPYYYSRVVYTTEYGEIDRRFLSQPQSAHCMYILHTEYEVHYVLI